MFAGHFPFVAVDLLGGDLTTITVLRDPVERTISFLRQRKRNNPVHKAHRLEQMYEHPFYSAASSRTTRRSFLP